MLCFMRETINKQRQVVYYKWGAMMCRAIVVRIILQSLCAEVNTGKLYLL